MLAILAIYADGVKRMKVLPRHDPRSWTFQVNIHAHPTNEPITAIFTPTRGRPAGTLTGPLRATWRADVSDYVRAGRIDPAQPPDVIVRARYNAPLVPVTIAAARIEPR